MSVAVAPDDGMLERVVRLEQRQRRVQRLTVALLGVAGLQVGAAIALLFLGARVGGLAAEPRVLDAERVVLRDADGRIHAELAVDRTELAGLSLYDAAGVQRARLTTNGLYLSDRRGTVQASLRLMPGATADEPFVPLLRLSDGQGTARGSLVVQRDGASALVLSNAEGASAVTLGSEPDGGGHLAMAGRRGTYATWLGALPDDSRALMLTDADGHRAAMLSVGTGGATQLSLSDVTRRQRVEIAVLPDGSPHFQLVGSSGKSSASLDVTPSGAPILELSGPLGGTGVTLVAAGASAGLLLRDRDGKDVAGLDTEAGRWPRLFLAGQGGHVASMLTVSPDGAPSLGFFDARGRVRALLGQFAPSNRKGKAFASGAAPYSLTFLNEAGDVIRRVPR